MQNASLGNRERAGTGIEAPLDADSAWIAPDWAAGVSGWGHFILNRQGPPPEMMAGA